MDEQRNRASEALTPENDPVIGQLKRIEDLGVRASLEATCYDNALMEETRRGIDPDASVHEHRMQHETLAAMALLEAATRWFVDPLNESECAERITALRSEPTDVRARGLMQLMTELLDYEKELAAGSEASEQPPVGGDGERGRLIRFRPETGSGTPRDDTRP